MKRKYFKILFNYFEVYLLLKVLKKYFFLQKKFIFIYIFIINYLIINFNFINKIIIYISILLNLK